MTSFGETKAAHKLLFFLVVLLVFGASCGKEDDNVETITAALSNRLTQALDFEDGELIPGAPPAGNDDPSVAPQVDAVETSGEMAPGQPFSSHVRLGEDESTTKRIAKYLFPRFQILPDIPHDVVAVIFHVEGATSYIRIPIQLVQNDDRYWAEIFGRLDAAAELRGTNFILNYAFEDADGDIGSYYQLDLNVLDEDPIEDEDFDEATQMLGGNYVEDDEPPGEQGETFPQIISFSHQCFTGFGSSDTFIKTGGNARVHFPHFAMRLQHFLLKVQTDQD